MTERQIPPSAESINKKLVISLRDISHTMRRLYEGKGSQKRVLIVLRETGTITQRELTQRLGIQPGSASEVIAKLEHTGLVTRSLSETDRRTADIALTEAGQRQAQAALEQRQRRHAEMFSALTDGEKEQLLALLDRINRDWKGRYPEERTCRDHVQGEPSGRHSHGGGDHGRRCNHDCAHCAHPCGRAWKR